MIIILKWTMVKELLIRPQVHRTDINEGVVWLYFLGDDYLRFIVTMPRTSHLSSTEAQGPGRPSR